MSTSTSISTIVPTKLFQDILGSFYSRRLLLHTLYQPPISTPPPSTHYASEAYAGDNSFDANVVMVLSVLICALICSLGLNSIIRCALRCSSLVSSEANGNHAAHLANKGVKQKALKSFPTVSYSTELKLPGLDTECAICLSEFASGEHVRLLPKCRHGFHVRCIDKWLSSHSSCPTCRHCLLGTCQKIVGDSQASSSESSQTPQETIVQIAPLEPESLVHGFR